MVTLREQPPEPTQQTEQSPARATPHDRIVPEAGMVVNLPNQATFHDRLAHGIVQAKRQGHGVALLILDVDWFAAVNEEFGWHVGDHLLQAIADRVVQCVRAYDTVAHLGGDGFAILLADTAESMSAATVARRLMKAFTAPFVVAEQPITLTISVGISLYPTNGSDHTTLLRNAEIAMYCAKGHSRNTYQFFTPALTAAELQHGASERRLLHALSADELVLFYEPRINLTTGTLQALEVEVRWNHPQHGWMEPAAFMSTLTKTDVIAQIDTWMLETACEQLHAWREAGLPNITISIPLAARSLIRASLTQEIQAILQAYTVAPSQLQLTIPMDVAAQHLARANELITDVQALGVRCMLSGFGAEQTWLGAVMNWPVAAVKIDLEAIERSVVPPSDAFVAALIALARSRRLAVVVEGVDREAQRWLLTTDHQIDIQGDAVGRAVPAPICEAMYLRRRAFFPNAKR